MEVREAYGYHLEGKNEEIRGSRHSESLKKTLDTLRRAKEADRGSLVPEADQQEIDHERKVRERTREEGYGSLAEAAEAVSRGDEQTGRPSDEAPGSEETNQREITALKKIDAAPWETTMLKPSPALEKAQAYGERLRKKMARQPKMSLEEQLAETKRYMGEAPKAPSSSEKTSHKKS